MMTEAREREEIEANVLGIEEANSAMLIATHWIPTIAINHLNTPPREQTLALCVIWRK